MDLKLNYRRYQRPFSRPLRTAHGEWVQREGIIVQLENEAGQIAWGEAAPVPGFSQTSISAIGTFLQEQSGVWEDEIASATRCPIPELAFALDSARAALRGWSDFPVKQPSLPIAKLLPAGKEALAALEQGLSEGYSVFKWKVGVHALSAEQDWCRQLCALLEGRGKLRLDANGSLDGRGMKSWLECLEGLPIDFLEQPMAPGSEAEMAALGQASEVRVALDESLVKLDSLALALEHFPVGPFVIKPALLGSPYLLSAWRAEHPEVSLVYSSVFETSVGREAGLRLAASDACWSEALGFGTLDSFSEDAFCIHEKVPYIKSSSSILPELEQIWKSLA